MAGRLKPGQGGRTPATLFPEKGVASLGKPSYTAAFTT